MRNAKRVPPTRPNRINKEIKVKEIRLLGVEGEQLGITSISDALSKAQELELDLVEISPTAQPPVCKIMNYGKYLYEKAKSDKEAKKKQKTVQVKEVKFRPNTDKGDYQVKLRNLIRFLEDGDKVKVTVNFRGREIAHAELGKRLLGNIKEDVAEIAVIEFEPNKLEGRSLVMIVAPKKV